MSVGCACVGPACLPGLSTGSTPTTISSLLADRTAAVCLTQQAPPPSHPLRTVTCPTYLPTGSPA